MIKKGKIKKKENERETWPTSSTSKISMVRNEQYTTALCFIAQSCQVVTPWTVACRVLCPWDFLCPLSMRIVQARKLEWVAMPSSRGSFQSRDQTQVSCIAGRFFTIWATREAQEYWSGRLSLLKGIFPTQESNQGLLLWRRIFYQLSYQRSPYTTANGAKSESLLGLNPGKQKT